MIRGSLQSPPHKGKRWSCQAEGSRRSASRSQGRQDLGTRCGETLKEKQMHQQGIPSGSSKFCRHWSLFNSSWGFQTHWHRLIFIESGNEFVHFCFANVILEEDKLKAATFWMNIPATTGVGMQWRAGTTLEKAGKQIHHFYSHSSCSGQHLLYRQVGDMCRCWWIPLLFPFDQNRAPAAPHPSPSSYILSCQKKNKSPQYSLACT